eukprot:TRINITY_DN8456_c0_g1_i1.p1 TRINITY_DN8456_c0_g1~~TRINITY_DN8456_c0_g1_i1.p1  ORF type:complete len:350 (+),score=76.99 TRINITY_DN8456_c0_g1_i1:151-1200(+)
MTGIGMDALEAFQLVTTARYSKSTPLEPHDYTTQVVIQTHLGEIRCYAPFVFQHLLEHVCGIPHEQWASSWAITPPSSPDRREGAKPTPAAAASALFSRDKKFLLKPLTEEEFNRFAGLLPLYLQHIYENPATLINYHLGLYSFCVQPGTPRASQATGNKGRQYFTILRNVISVHTRLAEIYDLKGSTHGRRATDEERSKVVPLLKDKDIIDRKRVVAIDPNLAQALFGQLEKDCAFLADQHLMDYSLLIAVAPNDAGQLAHHGQPSRFGLTTVLSYDGTVVLFLGIIDILQRYNKRKKAANIMRRVTMDESKLSIIPPGEYAARFKAFIRQVIVPAEAEGGSPKSPTP